jgi:VWFA-related protein
LSRRVLSGIVVALLLLTTASGQQTRQPASQPQTPTFKVEVEFVEVDVRVTDSNGNFVRDLTKDDFQLLEDGNPQTVAAFSLVDIPVEASSQAVSSSVSIESDVQSNERPFDGRVYVMILDDASPLTVRSKNAARRFIEEHFGPNDLMAIVGTWLSGPTQELTSNKRLLLAAVDKFTGKEPLERTLPQPIGPSIDGAGAPLFTLGITEAVAGGNGMMRVLSKVTEWLNRTTGRRKAVVLFSNGFAYDRNNLILDVRPSGRIGRTNVNIYAVDTRGPGNFQKPLDTLTMLAEETGGFVIMDNNDIDRGFNRLVAENSAYYLLAYYPSHPRDGRSHSIDVRVTRPGVSVRARRGYTSEHGDPPAPRTTGDIQASPATIAALSSPIQRSDLRMRVFAAPFQGAADASVLVGIELVGRDLPLDSGTVEISYVADKQAATNKEYGWRTDRITLNLQPNTRTRVERSGVSVLKRMNLPPGRYRLHVAAHDPIRNASGSVIKDLEVPDFQKARLALSGVLLTSRSGADMLVAHTDEQVQSLLPAPPRATRTFAQEDEITVFAEVYIDGRRRPPQVDIVTTVRSAAGAVVFEETAERASSELQATQGGVYRHVARVPLAAFEPGPYVLSFEARSRLNPRLTAERRVPFTVTATEPTR